jgi:hypothetical protein
VTTYRVEPDGVGTTTLWRYRSGDDQHPVAVGILPPDPLGNKTDAWRDATTVFRAAAAVLAPDEAVVDLVAAALWEAPSDDVAVRTPWSRAPLDVRHIYRREATIVLDALRQHAEGSAS